MPIKNNWLQGNEDNPQGKLDLIFFFFFQWKIELMSTRQIQNLMIFTFDCYLSHIKLNGPIVHLQS